MKYTKIFRCIIVALCFQTISFALFAQNNDCKTARLLCGNSSLVDNSHGGGLNDFDVNDRGCLLEGEHQSAWYAFRVQTAGTLIFTIVPKKITNDYDFAVWGPDITCNALGSPLRCNFSGTPGITGLSFAADETSQDQDGNQFVKSLDVQVGELYYLLVDNYSNNNEGFDLSWGGTAQLALVNPLFNKPAVSCNNVNFTNLSATCEAGATLTYTWDFGDGSPNTTVKDPTHQYAAVGTYNVTITTTVHSSGTSNGTIAAYTQPVEIKSLPTPLVFNGVGNHYCNDNPPITLSASPAGGIFTINGVANNILDPKQFTVGEEVTCAYIYTDDYACSNTISKKIKITPPAGFTAIQQTKKVCPLGGYYLEAISTTEEQALINTHQAIVYEWNTNATLRTVPIQIGGGGTYQVTIRNMAGCALKEVTYYIDIDCGFNFSVPTAFTPNGDGHNDYWEIFGSGFENLTVTVYNRWGEIVHVAYSKKDIWDGNVNGKPAPAGVYIWTARYEDVLKRGTVEKAQGTITLVR